MRWVHHYAPEFERRWTQFARSVGPSWRVDETYVKSRGKWVYLYRAVDRDGNTVDFRLSTRRDVGAAKAFFRKAIKSQGSAPDTVTLDGSAALISRGARAESRWPDTWRHESALIEISEQPDRAGSSWCETTTRSDARFQTVQDGGDHDFRHRTAAPDPQGPVQPRWAMPQRQKYARC